MERLTGKNEDGGYFLACSTNCESMDCSFCDHDADAMNKLGAYEDAEEHGLLVRLPCKVGDTYYCIIRQCGSVRVEETKLRYQYIETAIRGLGKWAFSTREEAEAAIADMREADDAADHH